jgi:hypothetical protein
MFSLKKKKAARPRLSFMAREETNFKMFRQCSGKTSVEMEPDVDALARHEANLFTVVMI